MSPDGISQILVAVASMMIIPWCAFVTFSLFNQRQEIALLKLIIQDMREALQTFNERSLPPVVGRPVLKP